jgi:hypothetical protein
MEKVNLAEKLARISTHWDPKVVAELNGQLLFEPATTLNTGNVRNARTRETLERI